MSKNVRIFELWDFRTSLLTIGLVSSVVVIILVIFYYPQISYVYRLSHFDKHTTGTVVHIEEQTLIRQTRLGSKVEIDHFDVIYTYTVGGTVYQNVDNISGKYVNSLKLLKIWQSDKEIIVNYSSKMPDKSMINIEESK